MLLLDEPTNHLDMESTDSLLEAVHAFGGAVIIVTHSEMLLHALATRLVVFDNGKVTFFEGTYQDFLDRVGWASENEISAPNLREDAPPDQTVSKKQLRRVRAELINKKSRTLGALKNRIDETESEIISLEEQTVQDNDNLLEASLKGNGEAIKSLSKSIHEAKLKIETLFSELERMHAEFESKSKEFEERLSATTEP
jgi:ATP-binding cassette subfamily F protein 3